jgi:hypothetical protein
VLIASGALSEDDALFKAVNRVANKGFEYEKASDELAAALEGLPDEQRLRIDKLANTSEYAKWRGAYALGLAVGLRLSGGAR